MLDEGVARSTASPVAPRSPRRAWAITLATPVAAYWLAWAADQALSALRARSFRVPYGLTGPIAPVVGVHPSLAAWVAAACAAVALVVRLAPNRRGVRAAVSALLIAPLGFGTGRDAIRWMGAHRATKEFSMVPACIVGPDTGGDVVELEGARFKLDRARALILPGASIRWSDDAVPMLLVRVDPRFDGALARHSFDRLTGPDDRCVYAAFVVDETVRLVPRFSSVFLWGTFALNDPDEARLRALMGDLTGS